MTKSDRLLVIVSGNPFPLRSVGVDRFEIPAVGESVQFHREEGRVVAVSDSQGRYPLRTRDLPASLLTALGGGASPTYVYQAPAVADADMTVDQAARHGLPAAAVEAVVNDIRGGGDYSGVHSLLVLKDDALIVEEYFGGFDTGQAHNLRSATKSVVSALVGAAVLRGEATLEDHPLAVIAAREGVAVSAHKASLTLADMMDMRHGLQCDDWDEASPGNERNIYGRPDWTAFILAIPDADGEPPASYCSAMPLMVGRYLELATGAPLPEFADEALFTPLGIAPGTWTWDFDLRAKDTPHGGQVHLRPRDMVRLGRLYLSRGIAPDGDRLLPDGWVGQTFAATMPLGDWRRYNDYWWAYEIPVPAARPVEVHMASGIGGQRITVIPALDMVVVLTGGSFEDGQGGPTRIIERLVLSTAR